ncbi:hypothetical protein [Bradyrhizobium genosp. SA-3]|uniref:hypothetical protein n=1 Tax=Bradyrhizobium genosp. SA-3 TaxID=508868 RepID=UPI001FDFB907|nr:hypothetical protein [Bradyrhizobium genosp. SA-3]
MPSVKKAQVRTNARKHATDRDEDVGSLDSTRTGTKARWGGWLDAALLSAWFIRRWSGTSFCKLHCSCFWMRNEIMINVIYLLLHSLDIAALARGYYPGPAASPANPKH